jgi:hypothetical protein
VQRQRGPQRGLGHGGVHHRVDHAGDGHAGRQRGIGQQAVDAGPQALDQPQRRQALQAAGRRVGHHGGGHAGGLRAGLRQVQPARLGHGGGQRLPPVAGFIGVEIAAQQDVHAHKAKPSRQSRSRRRCRGRNRQG